MSSGDPSKIQAILEVATIFVVVGFGLLITREYVWRLFSETKITASRVLLIGVLFIATSSITGASDIGLLALLVTSLSSVFFLYPVYVRDTEITEGGNENKLYLKSVVVSIVCLIIGIEFLPSPQIVEAGSTLSILSLYSIVSTAWAGIGVAHPYLDKTLSNENGESTDEDENGESTDEDENGEPTDGEEKDSSNRREE
ncbi:hypothetical protein ACH9L7_15570 [Haloferax sp. S1W]|uniref:hypothetical protein n=1 Tax=Haloferax sp. S1W TaxID=3377110 RepID=UPI0037C8FD38